MVTIREVAKLAGVSMTTVSRAFNPKAVIKEDTRQKIFKIANDIGYAPNISARGLVTNKKFVIGVFLSSIHTNMSTYLSDILSNIHDALPDNYLLSVEGIDRIDNIEQKVKNRFDGILVVSQSAADNQFIYKMKTNHIPMVVVLRKMDNPEIDDIYPDDERAILDAVNYIADQGHQRIGFIEGRPEFEATIARRRGIEIGCAANHLVLVDDAVKVGDFSPAAGKKLMAEILQLPAATRPTCVICANDDMALGAMRACYERGVKVPDDISIMGFDNVAYARLSTPSLTTINNPIQEMASAGIKRLISIIDNPHQERLSIVMTPALVIRESIGQQN